MLTRRSFLGATSVLTGALSAADLPILRPRRLQPGNLVGLVTPATYVASPASLELAEKTMQYFDLRVQRGAHVGTRTGYLGGTVQERVSDLHEMFLNPAVRAIWCVRGGYGTPQLLDQLDYDLIRRNPKIFIGYSDITALHLAIHQRTGLVTFHGPVALSRFTPFTISALRNAVFNTAPLGSLKNPPDNDPLRPSHALRVIRAGKAQGLLTGGNLSLIAATLGTPYEIQTKGKILFLEDVGEQPYNIDRMLTHLRLAGKLQEAAAIIWGECQGCGPSDYKPAFESTFSVAEVVDQILGPLNIPVLSGLTIGHTDDQLTLPLGLNASLDTGKSELRINEPGVI